MNNDLNESALFVGHGYIDFTLIADHIPVDDEKVLGSDGAVSFGGNAVTAAFCCTRLGFTPDLLSSSANDWLGNMFAAMVREYGIRWHERNVKHFSYSLIYPNNGRRAIGRRRDQDYLHGFPLLNLDGCRLVHGDGLQLDALRYYFTEARKRGIPTSLDGGSLRGSAEVMNELFGLTDIAVVSLRLCEQMGKAPHDMLGHLYGIGCKVGAVTLGEQGLIWYDSEDSSVYLPMPALNVPRERVIDTSGAGDIFHGAYIYSFLTWPELGWEYHFKFARAAAAYAVQHLGNEASLPTVTDVHQMMEIYGNRLSAIA